MQNYTTFDWRKFFALTLMIMIAYQLIIKFEDKLDYDYEKNFDSWGKFRGRK